MRKQLLEYDDVANDQRKVIYQQRNELLETKDVSALIESLRHGVFEDTFRGYVPPESMEEQWDLAGLEANLLNEWQLQVPAKALLEAEQNMNDEDLLAKILAAADGVYNAKVDIVGRESFGGFERSVMLQSVDSHWREHLAAHLTICARVSICAVTRKKIRSRNTSAKRLNCSVRCST